jgi:hypothetical protein
MKKMATENTTSPTSRPVVAKNGGAATKLLGVLVIALAAATAYFYVQYSDLKADPAKESQAEVDRLVAQVSKLIVLPEDEKPTVATVTDVEKLKDQPFFARAENGNKVLIYTQAKKAILFDPIENKLIEVAPINIGDGQTRTAPRPTPTPAPVTPAPTEDTLDAEASPESI